jgi:hypothetical protein
VVFYRFVKILEYEMANPGQDSDGKEGEVFTLSRDLENLSDGKRPPISLGQSEYVTDESGVQHTEPQQDKRLHSVVQENRLGGNNGQEEFV